jgi:septal ring factor EnvC (AmiA/AmiB activator)
MTKPAHPLAAARRDDSTRRRQQVLDTITRLAHAGAEISVSSVARAARVHRSLIYRHPDLHAAIAAAADQPDPTAISTAHAVSRKSLHTDLANLTSQLRRQDTHIRNLENRLAEQLGQTVWTRSGLGAPPDTEALQSQITHLEQEITELRRQLADRDDELDATRAANRQLITQLNA